MNTRERLLVMGLATVIGGWLLISIVRSRFIEPLRLRDGQIRALLDQINRKESELSAAQRAALELTGWRYVAFPADESVAQTLYLDEIRKMLTAAGIDRPSLRPGRSIKRGDVFTRLPVNIEARSTLDKLTKFLKIFEDAPYLQQIRRLRIQPVIQEDKLETFDLSLAIEGVSLVDAFAKDALPGPEAVQKAFGQRPDRTEKDFTLFAQKNPFQPTEIVRAGAAEKGGEAASAADERDDHFISATLFVDGVWEVWVTKRSNQEGKGFRQGEEIKIGGMTANVVLIEPATVTLQVGDQQGIVQIGANLSTWKSTTQPKEPSPPTETKPPESGS